MDPYPTSVNSVRLVLNTPALGASRFAGRFPTRVTMKALEQLAPMPAPMAGRMFDECTPRLSFSAITRDLGMDPSTEMVWQQFLKELLPGATTEVAVRQGLVNRMRVSRLDGALQKALLNRALSYYRNRVQKSEQITLVLDLRKAKGEGSRGGHIIGHTESGKPIYASGHTMSRATTSSNKHLREHGQKSNHMMLDLRKATGEGSRGGHIIGHTKSGKPVYDAGGAINKHIMMHAQRRMSHPQFNYGRGIPDAVISATQIAHPSYTAQDHHDAADLHGKRQREALHDVKHEHATDAHRRTAWHMEERTSKSSIVLNLRKAATNARGDHII